MEFPPPDAPQAPKTPIVNVTPATAGPGKVFANPASFLGEELFAAYREATRRAGARFNPEFKRNELAMESLPQLVEELRKAGFEVRMHPALVAAIQARLATVQAQESAAMDRATEIEGALAARGFALFPFQRIGVKWLAPQTGALLADEMGLGKTLQTLIAAPADAPILVVCPAVAKGVWAREAGKWRPDLKVVVLKGRGSFRWPAKGEMVVTNYDVLPDEAALALIHPTPGTVLVGDEAHVLKGGTKVQRVKRFRAIRKAVRSSGGRTWLLTATPLLNRPLELWSVLCAGGFEERVFGSWPKFLEMFHAKEGTFGGYHWGKPSPEVAVGLQRVMLRRARVQVLPELPAKTHTEIPVTLEGKVLAAVAALWGKMEAAGLTTLPSKQMIAALMRSEVLFEEMSRVRAMLATAKLPMAEALVEQFEEQDEPLVVFSDHRAPVEALGARPGWACITGETPPAKRTQIEDAFQAGQLKGVAATIKAGGVAITLTRSHHALFIDRTWTPELDAQAEDRICRIGQAHPVLIQTLVVDHALEEALYDLHRVKKSLVAGTVTAAQTGPTAAPSLSATLSALVK